MVWIGHNSLLLAILFVLLLLATLSLFPAYFLFHCFIFHSVSKSFLAERDMFPVQICINHFYNRIFIAHRLDQYRYFSISQKRSSSFSSMPGNDFISTIFDWSDKYGFTFPITYFFYFLHDLPPYLRTTKNPSKLEFFINLV